MTLFINNLPYQVTQADILELFAEYGAVRHIFYPTHWKTDQGLGFAFVEMSVKEREVAKLQLNGFQWLENQLQISEIISQDRSKTLLVETRKSELYNQLD